MLQQHYDSKHPKLTIPPEEECCKKYAPPGRTRAEAPAPDDSGRSRSPLEAVTGRRDPLRVA
eukprot:CAMPEP_0181434516 /NCGR_PEP_ID=MMETSP1110-20121109/19859_1 /TAXON_ID=174948 /ORGANISM="Symbiodinium sp., Strain CCMP421" /LENGTH=61 /DNA_ID=CAMNT_0023558025 /DNA_START=18 /DNA_END=204 /DNA_ORIENTATION=-